MAKNITIIEGEASPIPIFSRELAHVDKSDLGIEGLLFVTITTASFGSHGGLEAVRSQWTINDKDQIAGIRRTESETYSANNEVVYTGNKERFFDYYRYGWHVATCDIVPATHKAILSEWLRKRWSMDKLRGRITL